MMIGGFVITATSAGYALDPFTPARLVVVTCSVAVIAFLLTVLAVWGVENQTLGPWVSAPEPEENRTSFRQAMQEVWGETQARRFSIFVFVSMLAYSCQDLILEPFAGTVFGLTPGESTRLAGVQHAGVLVGMLIVGIGGSGFGKSRLGFLKACTMIGCVASAAALLALAFGGFFPATWPLRESVFALGVANGAFAVAAIGSMMTLVSQGREKREGVRMGLWGAAQAIAFGLGGFIGTLALDAARVFLETPATAYAIVFSAEAVLFLVSVWLAVRVGPIAAKHLQVPTMSPRDAYAS
jgi:BCD family chlorophyll transporter-like MFS transporter